MGSCRFTPLPQDLDNLTSSKPIKPLNEESTKELFKGAQGGRFWWLAVDSSTRGKGLAREIIKFCEEYTHNIAKCYYNQAYMRIRANYQAHTMYMRFGYAIDSEEFMLGDQKLIWMKKSWKII